MFDLNTLYASLLWGTIGSGFVLYGKKQTRAPAIVGGLSLIGITFFVYSPLILSLVSVAIIGACVWALRMGY